MWHVGMDWHSRQADLTVRDENGRRQFHRHIRGGIDDVITELKKIGKPFSITFEASTGYGHVHDELARIAHTVKVAHPGHLRLIFRSKRKCDRVDSDKICKLDYLDEVPQVHVPRHEVRAWRRMISHRNRMVGDRTATKCRIRAFLRSLGIVAPKSLWTKVGIEWLRTVELADEFDALMRDELVERLAHQNVLIRRVTRALDAKARAHPGVQLLMTIPGVGARTAEAIVAWIDDIKRFSSVRKVADYFGLTTCLDQSAGAARYGHITREGPAVVRRLVVEAAHQGVRRSSIIRAYCERIMHGDPGRKKIAIVATAHYIVRVMAAMPAGPDLRRSGPSGLRTGEVWRDE
jgi:transposase